ncbi:phosphatase PAP2 family protein [Nocardioides acrostichi]|uniref:Phosphatase PAP2 family protein n=1 Tax=Nocardioides acrostichi TaxID=2784339 RepID=A0A930V303_9ACTN|nr:phosphatase PAP2 family protein [Nocardioides acrostichi]MBF4162946.1 phosphatase PAP2 family protein [Nocardioides acrostichi]
MTDGNYHTSRRARGLAVAAWCLALVVWSGLIGIPNDPLGVFVWIWLLLVAWDVQAPRQHHLRFPRDWWPVLVGLIVYWLTRGIADNVGIPVHYEMPIRVDRWISGLFGGHEIPTAVLQHAWCADPCSRSTPHRWYDTLLTTVYASHFLVGLTLAAVLWVRERREWQRWMRRYLAINYAALVVYLTYPMAPPWLASQRGYLTPLARTTSRGWEGTGLGRANIVLQGMGNQVAAMPSLHTGVATLVALYGVWRLRTAWRFLLLLYPVAMGTALVYFAEHYVIDVLAGMALAAAVMVVVRLWEDRHEPVTPQEIAHDPATTPAGT